MLRKAIILAVLAASPSIASAGRLTVYNNTPKPIYKVFAWPKKLNPRTINILGFPIFPNSKAEVTIDNSYGDCQFVFQFDSNDPTKRKKRNFKKRPHGVAEANICGKNNFVWLGQIPYGKTQGKP